MTNCEVQIYIKKTQELFSNFETVVTFTCVQFKIKTLLVLNWLQDHNNEKQQLGPLVRVFETSS